MSKEKMLQEIERAQIVINQNKEKVSQGKMRQKYHLWQKRDGLMIQMD